MGSDFIVVHSSDRRGIGPSTEGKEKEKDEEKELI
jgi:hypothetical protein